MSEILEIQAMHDPFAGPEILLSAPTTEPQREVWTSAQMGTSATLAFNESISLRLRGKLDLPALRAALHDLVQRHESLRMTFGVDGTMFFVSACPGFETPLTDLSPLAEQERIESLRRLFRDEVETPFDLITGPLFRTRVVRLAAEEHLLVLTAHHIVCDGWSYAVMLYDLGALYAARAQGKAPSMEPAQPFSDFALQSTRALSSPENLASEKYWLGQFEGKAPVLDLPTDRPRPPLKSYESLREDYELPALLVQSVKKTGAKAGCSLVNTLMAAFQVLLHRLTDQPEIVVGLPAAGQAAAGFKGLVGHCVNTLPIAASLDAEMRFSDHLKSLRKTMLGAYDHQQFTYGSLLQKLKLARDPSRLPLVSVLFNVDQKLDASKLGFDGLQVEFFSNPRHFENFELFINAVESSGNLILEVQYNTDLFDAATVRRWMSMYRCLLEGIVRNPDEKLSRLPLVPVAELQKLAVEWNSTAAEFPRMLTVSQLFEEQVRNTPDRSAAAFQGKAITYRELDERSNRLAHRLRALGVQPGVLVGICLERSLEMLVSMLGVLKAGGGYVPLDPAYPKDRVAYMLSHSGLPVLISQRELLHELPDHPARVLALDTDAEAIAAESAAPLEQLADPENVAYVIYTSGSTGKPKGVMVPHRAVVNFLSSMRRKPGISERDVLVAVTTLSFDIAVLELYLPLITGAEVVIAPRETAADGSALLDLLESSRATMMQATPATWRLLLAAGWRPHGTFRVLCGGEAVPRDLINELLDRVDTVWNMYGPTETAVWSACNPIRSKTGPVSIGRPIDNTQIYLLDRELQPVAVGVAGELHIGGAGVTLGYLHRPDLTAERFIDNPYFDPFSADPAPKLYKTGDLARYLPDGCIEFIGRNDNQVKVRGFRIELGEIETVLAKHPGVGQNVVIVREDRPGDVRIVAYAIARTGQTLDWNDVRAHLRTELPEYMVPQNLVVLEEFPRTNNGKIERKALPAPHEGGDAASLDEDLVEPRTPSERLIADLWKELLRVERVGIHDSFFNLGGHSLLSMQFISRLEKKTGQRLNPRLLLLNTLEQLASQLKETTAPAEAETNEKAPAAGLLHKLTSGLFKSKSTEAASDDRIHRRSSGKPAQASQMQERMYDLEALSPGTTLHNLPSAFRLTGELDLQALERALNELVRRHEVLRTTFARDGKTLRQAVASELRITLTPIEMTEDRIHAVLSEEAARPFDLERDPLVRASLYRLSAQEHALFFMPHHAVWDGWSFDLFLREMDALYDAYRAGKPSPLPELPFQYGDFAEWHRKKAAGVGRRPRQPASALQLTTDRPRASTPDFSGAMHELAYPKALMDALTAVGRTEGATLSIVLLAAFKAFLVRASGQSDLSVGLPVQGRSAPGVQELIGPFVRTLEVRTRLPQGGKNGPSFREILRAVQDASLEAYEHQEDAPSFAGQAQFSFQDATQRRTRFSNLELGQFHLHPRGVPADLMLWFKATPGGLTGAIEYRTALWDGATVARFGREYEALLQSITQDPDRGILKATTTRQAPASQPSLTPSAVSTARARGMTRAMNPFFFESDGKRLLGIYHPPKSQTPRDTAVLLCYPAGQEYLRSHWAFRQLTAQLVRAGFPVLRFDYFATGDSEGLTHEGSLDRWKSDVRAAARELQALSGVRGISVVGLRLGAALAAMACRDGLAVRDLVLWDPVVSGKTYLSELEGLHTRLLAREPFRTHSSREEIEASGQLMGFVMPKELRREIEAVDLFSGPQAKAGRTWILASRESEDLGRLRTGSLDPNPRYRFIADGGEWTRLEEAHGSLLAPQIVQGIVAALSGK